MPAPNRIHVMSESDTVIGNVGSVIGSVDATVDMTASGNLQDFLNNELTQLSDPLA